MENDKNKPSELPPNESAITGETANEMEIRVVYPYPDPQQPVFANHMVVQHDLHEFTISFYQLSPPLNLDHDPENIKRQIQAVGGIPAKCVAKVVVSKGRMPEIVSALAINFYRQEHKKEQEITTPASEVKTPDEKSKAT